MQNIDKERRKWEYKIDNKYLSIEISDTLEHWLVKRGECKKNDKDKIVALDNILIEDIFKKVIEIKLGKKFKDLDIEEEGLAFEEEDLSLFRQAIQELSSNS